MGDELVGTRVSGLEGAQGGRQVGASDGWMPMRSGRKVEQVKENGRGNRRRVGPPGERSRSSWPFFLPAFVRT